MLLSVLHFLKTTKNQKLKAKKRKAVNLCQKPLRLLDLSKYRLAFIDIDFFKKATYIYI
jgi:hypothetical protein